MTDKRRPKAQGEKPGSEPEIMPPEHAEGQISPGKPRMRIFVDTHGTERMYAARLRPLSIILLAVTIGILSAAMFIALLGVLFIWIPIVVLGVAATIIAGLLRGYFHRAP
jgi:hypothetical protein